ncbi:PREDICTED: glutathione peroxidase 7-like [Priapulus caudatus]|uniref:Glutathione peroxidase n=1 Tax=Priapulus caudatus TaxID=37621 RepID=A0ABM1EMB5_PRICU|nr:PREDICTED: glutathione peroxidase 7-like [Priapulus caudatus]
MLSVDKDGKNVFNVMAFPSNEFGGQEPGPNEMIFQYATDNYGLNFPLFAKVNVRQEDVSPPWKFLTDSAERVPNWNFWKYLVGRDGNIIDAWGPHTSVDKIVTYIQKALAGEPQPKTEAKRTQEQSSADHKKAEDEL